MLNINVNWKINDKVQNQLKIIEALSNAKWDINIEWDIDEETLANIIIQLTLIEKVKEMKPKDWEKWKDWKDGKDWIDWKNGTDWIDWKHWKDGLNWKDWINWEDGIDWTDWENGEDWDGWKNLEFNWDWTRLWVRIEWEEKRDYRELKGRWWSWFGSWWWNLKKDDLLLKSTTLTAWTHNIHNTYKTYYCDTTDWNITLIIPLKWFARDEWFYIKRISTDSNIVSIQPATWKIEDETTVEIDDNTWFYFAYDWENYQALTY